MNITIHGKTMENLRNRISVKLVNNEKEKARCKQSKPNYMSHKIFENNSVAIWKSKILSTLNKPAYIGMCMLNLSKVLMYKFPYDCVKNKYSNNSRLLFTDMESLMYEIKTEDVRGDKEMFDFSNY